MDEWIKLFSDLDLLAELCSNAEVHKLKNIIRDKRVSSEDSSEQGAYFCAVSKDYVSSFTEAFPLLLIYELYRSYEWELKPILNDKEEWKKLLRFRWLSESLSLKKDDKIAPHKFVDEETFRKNWLPIAYKIEADALQSPICRIARYADINAWNFSDYIIETETEYVIFEYWTTA